MTPYNTRLSILNISGKAPDSFLQGQITQDIHSVNANELIYTALCNQKGRVIADGYLIKANDDYLFIIHESLVETVQKRLQKYAQLSGCLVSNDTRQCVGYQDQNHLRISKQLSLCIESRSCCDDHSHWEAAEIEDQIPRIEERTSALFTPHMLGLDKLGAISFKKGCYVGQEIIARTHYKGKNKRTCHFIRTDTTLTPGTSIDYNNSRVQVLRSTSTNALVIG